jgi:hypothetical protein
MAKFVTLAKNEKKGNERETREMYAVIIIILNKQ